VCCCQDGWTALYVGAQNNNEQVVKTLVKLSTVSVDAADKASGDVRFVAADFCAAFSGVAW
jgi:hypothetical protein